MKSHASTYLFASAALLTSALHAQAPVVINEFNYDDSGSDNYEFVELYANVTTDISGWTLNGEDGTSSSTSNGSITIPAGTILNAGEFYLISSDLDPAVYTIDLSANGINLENGADGLYISDANGVVVDSVLWEVADWTNPLPTWIEGTGIYGAIQLHENARFNSASRSRDGQDTDVNGCDFIVKEWSPGASNNGGFRSSGASLGSSFLLPLRRGDKGGEKGNKEQVSSERCCYCDDHRRRWGRSRQR